MASMNDACGVEVGELTLRVGGVNRRGKDVEHLAEVAGVLALRGERVDEIERSCTRGEWHRPPAG